MAGFVTAWITLLALAALVRFGAELGRWLAAYLLARVIRSLVRGARP